MGMSKKILVIWSGAVFAAMLAGGMLPHGELDLGMSIMLALMLLLSILAFYIFRHEQNSSNKAVFLNFAFFFLCGALQFSIPFSGYTGFFFVNGKESFYFAQYYSFVVFVFFMAFSIVYLVIDSLFRDARLVIKYLAAFLIVAGFLGYYYHPVFYDPEFAYKTPDLRDWKSVDAALAKVVDENDFAGTVNAVSKQITLPAWKDGNVVGVLSDAAEKERIAEILPYLEGSNFQVLLWKPLFINVIKMDVLIIVFVLLFFGYQYKKDPPQGAYMEKIVFLFLPYATLEILHNYSFIRSVDVDTFAEFQSVGYYLTSLVLLGIGLFFSLRLSFLLSVKGEYYERELVSDPEHISRWRDSIDNLVVRHFLDPQTIHGRLFAPREARSRT
jgi:hypothetical protein